MTCEGQLPALVVFLASPFCLTGTCIWCLAVGQAETISGANHESGCTRNQPFNQPRML